MSAASMGLIHSIKTSPWVTGFKTVKCSGNGCARWLTQRHLSARSVGVSMEGNWYCCFACLADTAAERLSQLLANVGRSVSRTSRMPLGMTLISRGQLTYEQFQLANEDQKQSDVEIGAIFTRLGFATEEQVIKARAQQWGCPVFAAPRRMPTMKIVVPPALLRLHAMVPLLHVAATNSLLVGFMNNIEYGALYAIEQMTGCKTQPCFVTENDFALSMQAYEGLHGADAASDELAFASVESVAKMTSLLCHYGREANADQVKISRCKSYLWARLMRGEKSKDLLFRVD